MVYEHASQMVFFSVCEPIPSPVPAPAPSLLAPTTALPTSESLHTTSGLVGTVWFPSVFVGTSA